nr:MAG TPA: tail collar fiber protein [Caudoviricetes sp.]
MTDMVPMYGFGGGGGTGATLTVTAPVGATVTVSKDGKSKPSKVATTGTVVFKGLETGTWTITIFNGTDTATTTVEIKSDYQAEITFVKIYGISRDITAASPAWARTDDAVGKAATASVGTTAGSSDFDSCYPWSGIVRETLSTGDVMVKIPKFWYRRYRSGDVEYIKIADKPTSGFTLHPAFNHSGVAKDYLYVGAYKTTESNKSGPGVSPLVQQTRATMRSNAKAKGVGWGIIDIAALSAIQMLILVEFADNNVQSVIGRGYCDGNTKACKTGTCDNVSGLTGRPAGTDGKVDVVWRGIEGLWGNVWEWVDGVNWNNGTYYVCNDPSKYADGTTTNYTALSFKGATNWSSSYITQVGLDTSNPHVMLPSAAGDGSETTYNCDACWSATGLRVAQHGGQYNRDSKCGLFAALLLNTSSDSATTFGSRLLYIPS